MSEQTPNKNPGNKRRRNNNRRRKPGNKKTNENTNQNAAAKAIAGGNAADRPSKEGGNKKRSNSRNRRPKSMTPSRLILKYENLMEQYLISRKKYFEYFARATGRQLEKIIKNYEHNRKELHQFESKLDKDWQKDLIRAKNDPYPQDRQYSTDHNLDSEGDNVRVTGEFFDEHLLETQKSENWAEDTEESIGTMDDYAKYKEASKY